MRPAIGAAFACRDKARAGTRQRTGEGKDIYR